MLKKIKIILFTLGISIFAFLIYKIGIGTIYENLKSIGYNFPIVFIPFFIVCYFDCLGWQYSFNEWSESIKLKYVFPIRWAGEAINILTPTAYVGGEAVKAYILKKRHGVPLEDGLASVVISKTVMTIAQIFFLVIGIIVSTKYITSNDYLILTVTIALVISIPLIFFFIVWQRKGLFVSISNLLEKFKIKIRYLIENRDKIESLDEKIRNFYKHKKKRFYLSFLYYLIGWFTGVLEVYTILYFMGYQIGFFEALVIESMIQLIKSCSFFIPASLGVVEGGSVLIFTALGLTAHAGLSYGIIRRVRELVWAGIGLIFLMSYGVKNGSPANT